MRPPHEIKRGQRGAKPGVPRKSRSTDDETLDMKSEPDFLDSDQSDEESHTASPLSAPGLSPPPTLHSSLQGPVPSNHKYSSLDDEPMDLVHPSRHTVITQAEHLLSANRSPMFHRATNSPNNEHKRMLLSSANQSMRLDSKPHERLFSEGLSSDFALGSSQCTNPSFSDGLQSPGGSPPLSDG